MCRTKNAMGGPETTFGHVRGTEPPQSRAAGTLLTVMGWFSRPHLALPIYLIFYSFDCK
jgi:hypothetical protein